MSGETALHYRGIARDGRGVVGSVTMAPEALAGELFRKRYEDVMILNPAGREVGGITRDENTGERVWWSE